MTTFIIKYKDGRIEERVHSRKLTKTAVLNVIRELLESKEAVEITIK